MKVAVLGSNGMLGYAVSNYFKKNNYVVVNVARSEFDLATGNLDDLWSLLDSHGIEVIINCAGVIKPQIAKMSVEHVLRVNTIFPHNLALYCNQKNVKGFHVTTDCVYTGMKGNYSETDCFDANDVYGMSKNGGEPRTLMTLRTSIIGEEKGQSRSLLEWARAQKGKTVNGFTDHSWNGVTTLAFAKAIHQILQVESYRPGLFHIHSPKAVTKYELLQIFDRAYDLKLDIQAKTAPEFCDRTLSSNFALAKELVVESIEEQVRSMRDFFSL